MEFTIKNKWRKKMSMMKIRRKEYVQTYRYWNTY